MAKTDPLAQLKDIHLPDPISWWPLAPGWYVLLALFLFFTLLLIHYVSKRRCAALAKKKALVLLNSYQEHYKKERDGAFTSAQISELLRRVALVYYPRKQVAGLYGEAWLRFLNETSNHIDFNPVKESLLEAPFRIEESRDLTLLFSKAKLWIKQRGIPCSN